MGNVETELALFSVEFVRVTSDVIFIVCSLMDNSYEPIRQLLYQPLLNVDLLASFFSTSSHSSDK